MTGRVTQSVMSTSLRDMYAARIIRLAVMALLVTAPFFLYPLFERPSVSQSHYIAAASLSLCLLSALMLLFVRPAGAYAPLIPGAIFLAVLLLSAIFSPEPLFCFKELLFTLGCAGIGALLVLFPQRSGGMAAVTDLLATVSLVAAVYGIAQNYGFEILGYQPEMKQGKLSVISVFGHPNYLAAFLGPMLPVMFQSVFSRRGALVRVFHLMSAAAVFACILLAGTRGAWLSLAVASSAFVVFVLRRGSPDALNIRRIIHVTLTSFAVLVCLVLIVLPILGPRYSIRERFTDLMPLQSRLYSARMAAEMLRSRPVLGVGFGRYKVLYWDTVGAFQKRPENRIYDYLLNYGRGVPPLNVHNEYVEFAAEAGILGLAAFFFFLVSLFTTGWRRLGGEGNAGAGNALLPGLMAGIVFLLADALLNFPLHQPLSALLFWVLCGLILSSGKEMNHVCH
ncbi:MAG TPA: O-antigen ligase family protein [Candidatus Sumerlaeota bacterium]|nr:O-antigen ligase family protein [Candidatus Sumerlaeota bacterium]